MKLFHFKSKLLSFLMFTFCATSLKAQNIEYSPLQKKNGYFPTFYALGGKEFFATTVTGISRSLVVKHYTDFKVDSDVKVSLKINKKSANYEGECLFNNEFYVFASQYSNKVYTLYMQRYNRQCEPIDEPLVVSTIEFESRKSFGNFNVIQSKNKKYLGVYFLKDEGKKENTSYGYKIFDAELNVFQEGSFVSPYQSNQELSPRFYLSDVGHLFLSTNICYLNERGNTDRKRNLADIVLYKLNGADISEFHFKDHAIGINKLYLSDMTMYSDANDLMTFTGLYGESGFGAEGAFLLKIDFKKSDLVSEVYNKFSKEFITANWKENKIEKAEKREEKGRDAIALKNYDFRDMQIMEDGSVVVVIEEYYMEVRTRTDSQGRQTTTYHYYYNDVIIYKVSESMKFDWVQRIRKAQHSVNDGGYTSSIGGYFNGNEYVVFFNDGENNYDESGNYNVEDGERLAGARSSKAENCVARSVINLENGDLSRKIFSSRDETDAYCIPKRFCVDYQNKTVMMYFQTRTKEKFGLLSF